MLVDFRSESALLVAGSASFSYNLVQFTIRHFNGPGLAGLTPHPLLVKTRPELPKPAVDFAQSSTSDRQCACRTDLTVKCMLGAAVSYELASFIKAETS